MKEWQNNDSSSSFFRLPRIDNRPKMTTNKLSEAIKLAAQKLEPAEKYHREIVSMLMPDIFVLRVQGYSFMQLKQLLNISGFDIQTGDLRTYYNEHLFSRIKVCEALLTKSLLAIAEIEAQQGNNDIVK